MISLGTTICDEFKVNKADYVSVPSLMDQARIGLIEEEIINRTEEFLTDPEGVIAQWEELTGEQMPSKYVDGMPEEICWVESGGKGKMSRGLVFGLLPTISRDGSPIRYSEENLVTDFLKDNRKVYILRKKVMKRLKVA